MTPYTCEKCKELVLGHHSIPLCEYAKIRREAYITAGQYGGLAVTLAKAAIDTQLEDWSEELTSDAVDLIKIAGSYARAAMHADDSVAMLEGEHASLRSKLFP